MLKEKLSTKLLVELMRIKKYLMKITFIPGIWTQSTAVPVAFERNSAKVSSAIERSLPKENKGKKHEITCTATHTSSQPQRKT